MTLVIALICAVISTLIWYFNPDRKKLKLSVLCFEFWGASLMWLVDAVFEFAELKEEFFTQSADAVVNDALLGLCVAVLGVVVYLIVLLISDPNGVVKQLFSKKDNE
ncbi:MAG: hypothetical protein IJ811_01595 [Clostridia bacterium]|nr:hypothetical protein [Clostridia bacterium]